jgi:hypothetical protein
MEDTAALQGLAAQHLPSPGKEQHIIAKNKMAPSHPPVASIFHSAAERPPRAIDSFCSDLLPDRRLEHDSVKLLCLVTSWLPSTSTGWLRMERPRPFSHGKGE